MDLKEIVTTLGGPTKIGTQLGIRPQAVSQWISQRRVPAERVPALLRIANARGVPITPEELRADIDWSALR